MSKESSVVRKFAHQGSRALIAGSLLMLVPGCAALAPNHSAAESAQRSVRIQQLALQASKLAVADQLLHPKEWKSQTVEGTTTFERQVGTAAFGLSFVSFKVPATVTGKYDISKVSHFVVYETAESESTRNNQEDGVNPGFRTIIDYQEKRAKWDFFGQYQTADEGKTLFVEYNQYGDSMSDAQFLDVQNQVLQETKDVLAGDIMPVVPPASVARG